MLKETLCFTSPCHLSVHNRQLAIVHKQTGEYQEKPMDDIGVMIIEHPTITFTHALIAELAQHKVAVVYCDASHHPCSMLLHMVGHTTQTLRFRQQLSASEPLKKQLWKQVIQAKIRNQQCLLVHYKSYVKLPHNVLSGDTTNTEAQAARLYWPALFGTSFLRRRHGGPPNPALNYGYAILRAAVARALTLAGLLPVVGIQHKNKYNNFCLADDIMEPYRPFVDRTVKKMLAKGMIGDLLGKEEKQALLAFLHQKVSLRKETSVLLVALQRTAQSLAHCFSQEKKRLFYASLPN